MKVKSESEVAQSCPTLATHELHAAYQAPPSMGFSKQKYWSGVPLPSSFNNRGEDMNLDNGEVRPLKNSESLNARVEQSTGTSPRGGTAQ